MSWRIDVDGSKEGQRKLEQLVASFLDLRPFWPRVVPLFVGWMREQFETEGSFFGHPWAPLSPAYLAGKSRLYPGRGILVGATRQLRRAASTPSRHATPTTLTLTIRDRTVDWHQQGTPRMPARPLIFDDLPRTAELEVEAAAEEYAREQLARLGWL